MIKTLLSIPGTTRFGERGTCLRNQIFQLLQSNPTTKLTPNLSSTEDSLESRHFSAEGHPLHGRGFTPSDRVARSTQPEKREKLKNRPPHWAAIERSRGRPTNGIPEIWNQDCLVGRKKRSGFLGVVAAAVIKLRR